MSSNAEERLIARIIQERNFRDALKARVSPELFKTAQCRSIFNDIWEHYHSPKHPGQVPTRRLIKKRHPAFKLDRHVGETIPELVEEMRQSSIASRILDTVSGVEESVEDDPYEVLEHLRTNILQIQGMTATSRDLYLHEAAEDIIRDYELAKNTEGIRGVPWPWEELNNETNGMLPEELIIVYGRLKSMKTFVGCMIAAHAYYEANRRVMFYSAEMSPPQLIKRVVCAICHIDYKALKNGKLSTKHEQEFYDMLRHVQQDEEEDRMRTGHRRSLLVTSDKDDARGIGGVAHIQAKAEEFEPDLIIVDSYYRLRDERSGKNDYDWKVQACIAQDLKHLAQRLQIPIIGITQANRSSSNKEEAEGMEDASFTDATGQEADLGLRVVKGTRDAYGTTLKIIVAAAREIEPSGFKLKVKPFTKFKFEGWLDSAPPPDSEPKKPKTTAVKSSELSRPSREANADRRAVEEAAKRKAAKES